MLKSCILLLGILLFSLPLTAQLRLPAIISSGMVLQQNDSASLWGWGNPAEKISAVRNIAFVMKDGTIYYQQ